MKALLMTKSNLEEININLDLENYYKTLNCSCIDILTIRIKDKDYDLIIDDEGKMKEHEPIMIFTTTEGQVVDYIATSGIICNYKNTEEGIIEAPLTQKDIKLIKEWYDFFQLNGYYLQFVEPIKY